MKDINSFKDVSELIRAGFTDWKSLGEVNTIYYEGLILFNYDGHAMINDRWNFLERNSRGHIYDAKTGELIARAFPKFWNYGERIPYQGATIVEATEKVDGSLIILRYYNNRWSASTRGSFTSDQALWAQDKLYKNASLTLRPYDTRKLDPDYTYLCEAIYPENRIVVDYDGRSELVLIGCIDKKYGRDLYWSELEVIANEVGFSLPKHYTLNTIEDYLRLASDMTSNEEGFVLRYNNGERYKVKGNAYKVAHRLVSGISKLRTAEAMMAGVLDDMLLGAPDEFTKGIRAWRDEIQAKYDEIFNTCQKYIHLAYAEILSDNSIDFKARRKAYAKFVYENIRQYQSVMFAMEDHKEFKPLIWKLVLESIKENK